MSEHALPEDVSQWPEDPFELLGVERGGEATALKRNYTRLIRVYKPERFPDHFRRIREAYESALRFNEFFGHFRFIAAGPETAPQPADGVASRPAEEPRPEVGAEPSVPAPFIDETIALWERAIRGEEADAYRGLLKLHWDRPAKTDIILRLYWLLSLDPKLDPDRQPADWLVLGLKSTGMHATLMELHRREIETNPDEAFSTRFGDLLDSEYASASLPELYIWRWRACRKLERWDVLKADLPIARERLRGHSQSAWLRLLLIACDAAAWIHAGNTYFHLWDDLEKQIRQLSHLAIHHGDWFDRFDFLVAVRQQSLLKLGCPIRALIARSWHAPFEDFRETLTDVLGRIDNDAEHWLEFLDELFKEAPALLGAFGELLQQYENRLAEAPLRPPAETIVRLFIGYVGMVSRYQNQLRPVVLKFCCRELIDPLWLIEAAIAHQQALNANDWESLHRTYDWRSFDVFACDWPLLYVCQARRLFWS